MALFMLVLAENSKTLQSMKISPCLKIFELSYPKGRSMYLVPWALSACQEVLDAIQETAEMVFLGSMLDQSAAFSAMARSSG